VVSRRGFFLPRPRVYEALLVADLAVVLLLVRFGARMGVDPLATSRDLVAFGVQLLYLIAFGFVVRAAWIAARGGRRRLSLYARTALRPAALVDLVRFVLATLLTSYVYTWLKVMIPLLNGRLVDDVLFKIETVVHFGVNPSRFSIALFPFPALWRALDVYYASFIWVVIVGIGWFGATLSIGERARFAAGFSVLWIAASWWYLAMPSLGPCYVFPDDYADVKLAMPWQAHAQDALIRNYGGVRSFHSRPSGTLVSPALGVAAMPSLHVGALTFFAVWARRRSRLLFRVFACFAFLTFFGSLVSGWHYAIDGYAGALLGAFAVFVGERFAWKELGAPHRAA
jgi:PAP2 superfamily